MYSGVVRNRAIKVPGNSKNIGPHNLARTEARCRIRTAADSHLNSLELCVS